MSASHTDRVVRIGAGAAFANDSALAVPQLLESDPPDYIVLEHLAEGLMSPLAEAMARDPALGFSTNVLDIHIGPNLARIVQSGVKVITNAGGLNPAGAAAALERLAAEQGLALRIAHVEGDDLRGRVEEFAASRQADMYSGRAWPEEIVSANAYIGAFPIAEALSMGADIVIVGRSTDSALTLGPLIHEFGWKPEDYDLLAAGTLAGHLLECGAMSAGGTFTDWLKLPDWENIGYPIAECRADGTFAMTKSAGTGGLVSAGTVTEQMVYEIGDPSRYLVPDVACDFTGVRMADAGPNRVEVSGARGRAPNGCYKVCVTHHEGWRMTVALVVVGQRAVEKARRMTAGLLNRAARVVKARQLAPAHASEIELVGGGDISGFAADDATEVTCRMVTLHETREAANLYAHETRCSMTNASAGTMAFGPAMVTPVNRLFSFLLPRREVPLTITLGAQRRDWVAPEVAPDRALAAETGSLPPLPDPATFDTPVPLARLAWARSGDKGDIFNVGVIARKAEYYPYLLAALDEDTVTQWYAHVLDGQDCPGARRYPLPGSHAMNFVFENALRGGQTVGLKVDSNAKGMGQRILAMEVHIPAELAAAEGLG
ncbi:MAG: DUF1446 domain-containing protein [Novosphingobium sp.]|nr:DUF1446 domain-containing protein [Novosphingobium sp.]